MSIAAGATFDVSALSTFTLSGNTTLTATGAALPATIAGGSSINLGSQPLTLNYDGAHPALTISQGTLSLNGNPFTVNGSVLAPGSYTLIHQANGNVAGTGPHAVAGTAVGAGTVGSIAVSGGDVNLIINVLSQTNSITGITNNADGTFTLGFVGTPHADYYILSTSDLTQPMSAWTPLPGSTNTVPDSGAWSFVVSNAAPAFYRAAALNPAP